MRCTGLGETSLVNDTIADRYLVVRVNMVSTSRLIAARNVASSTALIATSSYTNPFTRVLDVPRQDQRNLSRHDDGCHDDGRTSIVVT